MSGIRTGENWAQHHSWQNEKNGKSGAFVLPPVQQHRISREHPNTSQSISVLSDSRPQVCVSFFVRAQERVTQVQSL